MGAFRRLYGAPLPHLVLMAASFALVGYAGVRLLGGDAVAVAVWFLGAALLHDLVFVPGYTLLDRGWQAVAARLAPGVRGGRASRDGVRARLVNHVRVPATLSALLFVVYFPLILGPSDDYLSKSGLPGQPFAERWLLVCALLFAASAVVGAVRYARGAAVGRSR